MDDYRRSNCRFAAASGLALAFMMPGMALAQDIPDSGNDPAVATQTDSGGGLEEIVVTARKREESLQETPISITALSGDALEQRGVTTVAQIDQFAPNVEIGTGSRGNSSSTQAAIFIRGIGQLDWTLTTEPGVGLYIDGIYVARSVGSLLDMVDVERVEVLRGPQGTLFGKNAVGGAISIITREPARERGASFELTYGSFKRIDAKASVDLPISDVLRTRFSIASLNRDGYQRRLLVGDRLGGYNRLVGRATILFEPSADLSFNLTVDGTKARDEANPGTMVEVGDGLNGNAFSPFLANENARRAALGLPLYTQALWGTDDIDETNGTDPNISNTDIWGISLIGRWDISDRISLKSLTGYRHLNAFFTSDNDGSPLAITRTDDDYKQRQFSQEIQLAGKSFSDRLNWLLGGYYFRETGNNINTLTFHRGMTNILLFGQLTDPELVFQSGGRIRNSTIAGFGQGTFSITNKLSLTAGIRYTHEKKGFDPDQYILEARRRGIGTVTNGTIVRIVDPLLPKGEVTLTVNRWSPRVGIEYQWSDDILTYASFSTGFKSGGFGQRIFPGRTTVPTFGPEDVKVYEVGLKTEFFDNRVRFNAAVYHTDYDDIQVNFFDGVATRPQNAGKARIRGLEGELEAAPVSGLTLNAGIGYTDAELTELDPNARGVTLDTQLPYTSKWTLSGAASYAIELGELGRMTLRGDWSYRSSYSPDIENNIRLRQKGYHLLNAGILFEPSNSPLSFQAGVRNLTDERYIAGGLNDAAGVGYAFAVYSPPREWFVTGRFEF